MEQRKKCKGHFSYIIRIWAVSLLFVSHFTVLGNTINFPQGRPNVLKNTRPIPIENIDIRVLLKQYTISTNVKLNHIVLEEISILTISEINFQSAYKYGKYKIAIGNYKQRKDGGFSINDSEGDYGLRLFLYDENDNLLFKSSGAHDTWKLLPAFYELKGNKGLMIFLEKADEEFLGIQVFKMNNDQIQKIGDIDHLAYNEFESVPSRNVIDIYDKMNDTFEFVFSTDFVWEINSKTGEYIKKKSQDVKYIYNREKLLLK